MTLTTIQISVIFLGAVLMFTSIVAYALIDMEGENRKWARRGLFVSGVSFGLAIVFGIAATVLTP